MPGISVRDSQDDQSEYSGWSTDKESETNNIKIIIAAIAT